MSKMGEASERIFGGAGAWLEALMRGKASAATSVGDGASPLHALLTTACCNKGS